MDYKIKFEYKGIGKQATQARQRAIQAQKTAEKKTSGSSISQNKELISAITKLIDSNKRLEAAVRRSAGLGGGGGRPGTTGGGGGGDSIGGIGRALPLGLGAALAGVGFAMSKIQQIGRSYMDLASQQIRSVGSGGFRTRAGIYGSAEMGAGMGAFARSSGRFARNRVTSGKGAEAPLVSARGLGAAYGLAAEETFGMAGTFERAGGDYMKTAAMGRAAGIESEMPIFLQGISSTMEEAIKSGLDASDMAKTMGKNLAELTKLTPGKSVDAAMRAVASGRAAKEASARGQVAGFEGFYTREASKSLTMEKLQDPEQLKKMYEAGDISAEQMKRLGKYKTYSELEKGEGGAVSGFLRRMVTGSADESELRKRAFGELSKQYGNTEEGMQRAMITAQSQGWSGTEADFRTMYKQAAGIGGTIGLDVSKGAGAVAQDISYVEKSAAGAAVKGKGQMEDLVMGEGAKFMNSAIAIEKAMQDLARALSPSAESLKTFTDAVVSGIKKAEEVTKAITPENVKGALIEGTVRAFAPGAVSAYQNVKKIMDE
jgi:hypothetical protein